MGNFKVETIFLFDVDGTLTSSRQPMEPGFAAFFHDFVASNPVYLISGSDYSKIQEQVPQEILDKCRGVFGCSGAQYHEHNRLVFSKEHSFPDQLKKTCEVFIEQSEYPVRTGTHIEERSGLLNVSVVGRNGTLQQRKSYFEWDRVCGERARFVRQINASEMPYEASAGGEISIDIVPIGWNKSVAKKFILSRNGDARLVFFGDRICEGGNDLPLAKALSISGEPHSAISVNDYRDTWRYLTEVQSC